jgi:hypothetical protein
MMKCGIYDESMTKSLLSGESWHFLPFWFLSHLSKEDSSVMVLLLRFYAHSALGQLKGSRLYL